MKRCPYCKELNGDSRSTCFKCGKKFPAVPYWASASQQLQANKGNPRWEDIVLRTWHEKDELRLKENSLMVSLSGSVTEIPMGQIVSVTISKEPTGRMFPGMIEIKLAGGPDTMVRLTSFLSVGTGNVIRFPHGIDYKNDAYRLRRAIMEYQKKPSEPKVPAPATSASIPDEIRKYKELLDMGAITQEEYDQKKKQLLGL